MNLDELERYLHDRSDTTHLGHTPVQMIMRRGSRRRARHRTMTTAGVLAVGTLGAVAAVQVLTPGGGPARISSAPVEGDPLTTEPAAPDSTEAVGLVPADDSTPPAFVDSPLVWNKVEVGSAESLSALYGWGITPAANPPFLAISTEPGRSTASSDGRPTVYHSDDGVHWKAGETLNVWSGTLSAAGDTLYRVSTMASAADLSGSGAHLLSSTDGNTWTSQDLPYDLNALHEPGISSVSISNSGVARVGDELLVAAIVRAGTSGVSIAGKLDVEPQQVEYRPNYKGVVVHATAESVACSQLEAEEARVNKGVTETTVAHPAGADASTESEGSLPPAPTVTYRQVGTGVVTDDGNSKCYLWGDDGTSYSWDDLGFSPEVVRAMAGIPVLFRSSDGVSFETVEVPAALGGATDLHVGTIGDDYLITAASYDNTGQHVAVVRGRPDRGWQQLPSLDGAYETPTSVSAIGDTPVLTGWTSAWTLHGDQWVSASTAQLAAPQTSTGWQLSAAGPRGIVVALQVGDLVDPGMRDNPDQGWEFVDGSKHWLLFFSQDGITWSKTELSDLIGDVGTKQVYGVQVTGDQVLVSVREPASIADPNIPLPGTTMLVGTLA